MEEQDQRQEEEIEAAWRGVDVEQEDEEPHDRGGEDGAREDDSERDDRGGKSAPATAPELGGRERGPPRDAAGQCVGDHGDEHRGERHPPQEHVPQEQSDRGSVERVGHAMGDGAASQERLPRDAQQPRSDERQRDREAGAGERLVVGGGERDRAPEEAPGRLASHLKAGGESGRRGWAPVRVLGQRRFDRARDSGGQPAHA